jgi:anti-anti-sigma regulatory factor/HAMP domain-containing protein
MFLDLKIHTKILLMLSLVTTVAISVNGYVSYVSAKQALRQESFNKLTAVRELKANQVEDYFQQIVYQVQTFSNNRMTVEAMRAFRDAFKAIDSDLNIAEPEMSGIDARIREYYSSEFMQRLNQNLDLPAIIDDYLPKKRATRILQDLYIASNPNETGAKDLLDAAVDSSAYSRAHRIYHPIIRHYLKKFGFYDIFLVDPETGHIVYTVFKEVDYGTSLLYGPYKDTNFAEAFKAAQNSDTKGYVKLLDFAPYHPSYNAQASFIASPIYDGEEKIGVLLFQMPIDRINEIMTSKHAWSEVGLGASGETYIVGGDLKIRNQSRFLIEDPEGYFDVMEKTGTSQKTIDTIRNFGSTIGLLEINTEAAQAALAGESGLQTIYDYRGISVLSSYRLLEISDVRWGILSEIDEAEAYAPARELAKTQFLWFLVLLVVTVVVSFVFSKSITRPMQALADKAGALAEGDLQIEIDTSAQDEIGDLARNFDRMRRSIQKLVGELEKSNEVQARAIEALSTPLIPLQDKVFAMPLVGEFDTRRIEHLRNTLVKGLYEAEARVLILDLTGVPTLESDSADGLIRAIRAARLLGVEVVISGMQPNVAEALANYDLNTEGLVTRRTLQSGLDYAGREDR